MGYYWYTAQPVKKEVSVERKKAHSLLLCGAPGSGKGTQCELLVDRYNYVHLSTGDILREEVKNGTPLGVKAKSFMDKGELVPDEVMIGIVNEKIQSPEIEKRGWILDGFPRTDVQAKALTAAGANPEKIIILNVPDDVLVERVTGRRTDPQTGKIYHTKYSPAPAEIADRLIQRSDDTKEKLTTRLTAYHKNINLILAYYKQTKAKIHILDGTRRKEAVFSEIKQIVETDL
uniref:Adenylate kinase active site lid domain-containing protein n=1 Tax=Arcella intermedia TaxID=1963864 RepID=A0A6B2LGU8_9EUKA